MKPINIIFLGRSGSGKGTQAKLLQKEFSLTDIDTGGILREIAKEKTNLGAKVRQTIDKGHLVPQWLVIFCWFRKLLSIPPTTGVIMEGSPRQLPEAKILLDIFHWLGRDKIKVIYLNVPAKEVKKRLLARRICSKCGKEYSLLLNPGLKKCPACGGKLVRREDDYPKAIKNRMLFFRYKIIPVINYFRKKGMVQEVDGERPIKEVYKDVVKKVKGKI